MCAPPSLAQEDVGAALAATLGPGADFMRRRTTTMLPSYSGAPSASQQPPLHPTGTSSSNAAGGGAAQPQPIPGAAAAHHHHHAHGHHAAPGSSPARVSVSSLHLGLGGGGGGGGADGGGPPAAAGVGGVAASMAASSVASFRLQAATAAAAAGGGGGGPLSAQELSPFLAMDSGGVASEGGLGMLPPASPPPPSRLGASGHLAASSFGQLHFGAAAPSLLRGTQVRCALSLSLCFSLSSHGIPCSGERANRNTQPGG